MDTENQVFRLEKTIYKVKKFFSPSLDAKEGFFSLSSLRTGGGRLTGYIIFLFHATRDYEESAYYPGQGLNIDGVNSGLS